MKPPPPLSDAAQAAISAELVRLTLPHPGSTERPSLELDLPDPATRRRRRIR
jgi:hypothetical protein